MIHSWNREREGDFYLFGEGGRVGERGREGELERGRGGRGWEWAYPSFPVA